MLRFVSQVNNFLSFRESFSRRPSVIFLKARGAFMLPFASGVNRFFRFREILFRLRFRKPFSLVAKRKFALNHANCQAASATIFKTNASFARKPAQAADFHLLLHYQPSPCAQVFLVHTVPAFEVINGDIIGTSDLPKGVVCLHGVGFAALTRGCFILLIAQATIWASNHRAARRCRCCLR